MNIWLKLALILLGCGFLAWVFSMWVLLQIVESTTHSVIEAFKGNSK